MSVLAPLIVHDIRLQQRYGILVAYPIVIALYVFIIWQFSKFMPAWFPALIIFTDPAVLGFFFLGALMMLEKSESTRSALAITPTRAIDYFLAKTITLSAISLVAIAVISLALPGETNHLMLISIAAITSIQFLAIGVPTALHFRTVSSYLIGASGILTPIVLPAGFAFFETMPLWAMLWPPAAQFRLVLNATGSTSNTMTETLFLFAVSSVGAVLCVVFATMKLKQEFGGK